LVPPEKVRTITECRPPIAAAVVTPCAVMIPPP
jgi:hypothetical protein